MFLNLPLLFVVSKSSLHCQNRVYIFDFFSNSGIFWRRG